MSAPVGDAAGMSGAGALPECGAFCVPADHPCLPGHFPGEPVVPGVVLLEHALRALGIDGDAPRQLAWVKFQRPLLPGQRATVHARAGAGPRRFEVRLDGELLASGVVS